MIKTELHHLLQPKEIMVSQAQAISLIAELNAVRATIPPTEKYRARLERIDKLILAVLSGLQN